ncbi:MAG: ArsR family transcriptional regulator [Chloroflexota bacterium]|nr:ArsR family transcriptional regulator [Chloroflexota bacterium]
MQPTRYRILEIIKENGDVTVAELARQLGMAPVSVRHHLDVLQGENLIWTPRVRRPGTVGRPRQVYALTEAANSHFPNNHGLLADSMLVELKQLLTHEQLTAMLERMADTMVDAGGVPAKDADIGIRIDQAVDYLNDRGYLARREEREGEIYINTLNCPYSEVAKNHPELCLMDLRLVENLIGGKLTAVTRLSQGDCRCAYRIDCTAAQTIQADPLK